MPDQITRLLDQIDRLDQEATKGPWSATPKTYGIARVKNLEGLTIATNTSESITEFIALARTFAPSASRALRTILTECESFEVAHDDEDNPFHQGVHWTVMAIRQAITDAMNGADNA